MLGKQDRTYAFDISMRDGRNVLMQDLNAFGDAFNLYSKSNKMFACARAQVTKSAKLTNSNRFVFGCFVT